MTAAVNYLHVLRQLQDFGLKVEGLDIGKMVRCRVEGGGAEKRGWYSLHELDRPGKPLILVGSYGVWHGMDPNPQKIDLEKDSLTPEEKAAFKARMAEEAKRQKREAMERAEKASDLADKAWRISAISGENPYLPSKGVGAHGIKFTRHGNIILPMMDIMGRVWGCQFILNPQTFARRIKNLGRNKEFWPTGMAKKGKFFIIGGIPTDVLLFAEGYATAATLYEATGLPVAIVFDAGNIAEAAKELRKKYRRTHFVFCADDDAFGKCFECKAPLRIAEGDTCPACGKKHKAINTGVEKAALAVVAMPNTSKVVPVFQDDEARWEKFQKSGHKITDFNDLHLAEGLDVVRAQLEDHLTPILQRPQPAPRAADNNGGEGDDDDPQKRPKLSPIESLGELVDRFSLIYGHGSAVFDHKERQILALKDMVDACVDKSLAKYWQARPDRKIVRLSEVGFDPTEKDTNITCNLWGGWPTRPRSGNCERLLELLQFMCNNNPNEGEILFQYVIKWLAYPIQHPGAKMKTALVIHGMQGTGKNLFFESIMQIYGEYGKVIDQSAIDDKFNDCFSKKLFIIADEVVARSDLYFVKNKLKGIITGSEIRINPKNVNHYYERNHLNMVFLSNELIPVVLEEDDRRYAVIWTPPKLSADFYQSVEYELSNGGVKALYYYLLNLPLGDFCPDTKPPMTQAKSDLIEACLDSTSRFWKELLAGEVAGITEPMAIAAEDLYRLYQEYCRKNGYRAAPSNRLLETIKKKHGAQVKRMRYQYGPNAPQASFYMPKDFQRPDDFANDSDWAARSVEVMSDIIKDYREGMRYAA